MQRNGQQPAKPLPEQNCNFIMMMLLAMYQIQSGGMLWSKGILRTGEKLLPMSQETKRSLWQKYAEPSTNLTPRQRRKLLLFRAFLWAKLLGKQSWQPCQMRVPPHVLCHLMTKCIPRIRISPISMPENPVKPAWQLTGSVVYDPSGFMYNGRSHNWSSYSPKIRVITSHSKHPWIALMDSDGNVWIGKIGDRDNLFRLIHSPEKEDEKATAIAFHPDEPLIAVAVKARIMVYKISPSLKPELHFTVSFYESGYFCPRSKFSADKLSWYSSGTLLTASSAENLSMCFFLKPDTNEVIGGFHGGINFGELPLYRGNIFSNMSPSCSCFSVNGNLVMTSYPDGTLVTNIVENTEKGLTLRSLKRTNNVLSEKIDMIASHPCDPSVFAIGMSRGLMHFSVSIVLVDHDGSVTITATIPDTKSPHFHKDWLLVSSGNRILFHKMNRCNIPCLVTEFHLQGKGTMLVRIDTFCVKTAPNGKVMLYYSISGESKLYSAEIALS